MKNDLGKRVEISELRVDMYDHLDDLSEDDDSSKYDFASVSPVSPYSIQYFWWWPFTAIKLTDGVIRDGVRYKLVK